MMDRNDPLNNMTIEKGVSLADFTTFKCGGSAKYFAKAKDAGGLLKAIEHARKMDLPFFILGEGSNVLFRDKGFSGLVIKMEMLGIEIKKVKYDEWSIKVSAGENWDSFVELMVSQGFYGVENLSGIPGSVGAAPVQNIGAYGSEICEVIESVEVYDLELGRMCELSNQESNFKYRSSIFKEFGKRFIVMKVRLRMKKNGELNVSYKDIKEYLEKEGIKNPTLKDVRESVLKIRKIKLPNLNEFGTAGSFFKNPIIDREFYLKLLDRYPELPFYQLKESGKVKIPLAFVIDKICGLKGYRVGNASVHHNQALVIVNLGGAKSDDIVRLSKLIEEKVYEKIGVVIEPEVRIL